MKAYYADSVALPLPADHPLPAEKYARLRLQVLERGWLAPECLTLAEPADDDQLRLVHTADHVHRVTLGLLTPREVRRLGLPWSPQLVERARRSVGATVAACRAALQDGVSINLGGGTHHAFADHGAGYCLFNDVAVAARAIQPKDRPLRLVVLDCDVHQGDGTAAIFADDPTVFTFSIHAAKNYPARKQKSDLDIELPDRTGDDAYLQALEGGLRQALTMARADLAIYLAGADPYVDDALGRLALTMAGLAERDRRVFARCAAAGLPVATVLSGGYARHLQDTVDIHLHTVRLATQAAAAAHRRLHPDPPG